MQSFNYVLVGGGLQNGLIAALLAQTRPEATVALVERDSRVGGNHTWCFHAADVSAQAHALVEPFLAQRWPAYNVYFPQSSRQVSEPYAAVTSETFARHLNELQARYPLTILCSQTAIDIEPNRVALASGEELRADVVIDARGPSINPRTAPLGYQKFLGLELEVEPGSAPSTPTLMDARVPQDGAYRFFYVLPLAPDRVLVEDTYYSQCPKLDREPLRQAVLTYATTLGLRVRSVVREEAGVLPLPGAASVAPIAEDEVIAGGYHGGFFHPTTGYSFPLALRVAEVIALTPVAELRQRMQLLARAEARQQRYVALLNRLLFGAFAPEERFHVLERFYRLPTSTIRRFYALTLTPSDRARILCGRPPRGFSLRRLLKSYPGTKTVCSPNGETI